MGCVLMGCVAHIHLYILLYSHSFVQAIAQPLMNRHFQYIGFLVDSGNLENLRFEFYLSKSRNSMQFAHKI